MIIEKYDGRILHYPVPTVQLHVIEQARARYFPGIHPVQFIVDGNLSPSAFKVIENPLIRWQVLEYYFATHSYIFQIGWLRLTIVQFPEVMKDAIEGNQINIHDLDHTFGHFLGREIELANLMLSTAFQMKTTCLVQKALMNPFIRSGFIEHLALKASRTMPLNDEIARLLVNGIKNRSRRHLIRDIIRMNELVRPIAPKVETPVIIPDTTKLAKLKSWAKSLLKGTGSVNSVNSNSSGSSGKTLCFNGEVKETDIVTGESTKAKLK